MSRHQSESNRYPPTPTGELAIAATSCAQAGIKVFPLFGVRNDGSCSCRRSDCRSVGKHPEVKWKSEASTNLKDIGRAFVPQVAPNVGAVVGSGVLVIDVDPRNGGDESLEAMIAAFGPFPRTTEVLTGITASGRGRHFWFRYPKHLTIKSRPLPEYPGVDVKADGGYVVAPPSRHASGVNYEFKVGLDEIAESPQWLVELATKSAAPKNASSKPTDFPISAEVKVHLRGGGIPIGNQRMTACRMARALLGRGHDIETAATAIFGSFMASEYDPDRGPWTYDEVLEIVESIAANPRSDSDPKGNL